MDDSSWFYLGWLIIGIAFFCAIVTSLINMYFNIQDKNNKRKNQ